MDKKILEKYKISGSINAEVQQGVRQMIKPGVTLLEIAEFIEEGIRKKGGKTAFPANTSLNDIAAHYIPRMNDETVVTAGDLLKVDIGVEVDGYISDSAFTFCSDKNPLIDCAEAAVNAGIQVIKPGIRVWEISKAIEDAVKKAGFGIIVNLTGHGLDRNMFHAPPSIPNYNTNATYQLQEGDVIALEPFVAKETGQIKESSPSEIYRLVMPRPVRLREARDIMALVQENYNSFPFAKRWLIQNGFSPVKTAMALRQLEMAEAIESYPPLKEARGQMVAQAEHTVIVSDPPIVTTKPEE